MNARRFFSFAVFLVALASIFAAPSSQAQIFTVTNCGAVPASQATLTAGKVGMQFVDPNGNLCVVVPFTRGVTVTGTFTPGASYTTGNSMAGLLTVATGLPAGQRVTIAQITVSFQTVGISGSGGLTPLVFNAAPATTFADATTPTLNAADAAKLFRVGAGALSVLNFTSSNLFSVAASPTGDTTVDAGGNLYLVLILTNTLTTTTPGIATWAVALRY
jgi:hypothetical protein